MDSMNAQPKLNIKRNFKICTFIYAYRNGQLNEMTFGCNDIFLVCADIDRVLEYIKFSGETFFTLAINFGNSK